MNRIHSLITICFGIIMLGCGLENCGLVTTKEVLSLGEQSIRQSKIHHIADSCLRYAENLKVTGRHYTAREYFEAVKCIDSSSRALNVQCPSGIIGSLKLIMNDGDQWLTERSKKEIDALDLRQSTISVRDLMKSIITGLIMVISLLGLFLLPKVTIKIFFLIQHLVVYIKNILRNDVLIFVMPVLVNKWSLYRARAPNDYSTVNDKIPWMMF